ncbi:hypothetical protein JVU11DRAFT_8376 [Chiua virens]|nr:hypothetical protein JVU11DRAFT_8376 [Chiua virens]
MLSSPSLSRRLAVSTLAISSPHHSDPRVGDLLSSYAEAQLEALLEITNTSARQAIAEYKKVDNDVPTIHPKGYHPLDSATDTVALKKATRLLQGSCHQLCASLAPPQQTFHSLAKNFEFACVRVAIRAKIADALESYPEGLHADELAKLVSLEKGKLARVLRLLASKGCFTEVKPGVFANNRISLVALSTCNAAALSLFEAQNVTPGAIVLYESMSEPDWAESYHPDKAPLMHALEKKGIKGDFFDWIRQDDELRDAHSQI